MTVFRGLIVLSLLVGTASAVRALMDVSSGPDPAPRVAVTADGQDAGRIVTPLRARKALEALMAMGLLLYLVRRSRRPWHAKRGVGVQHPSGTLSSFRW